MLVSADLKLVSRVEMHKNLFRMVGGDGMGGGGKGGDAVNQCCGSGSAWNRIFWEVGSGSALE